MVDIIAARAQIGKFFYEYGFNEILSSVPQNRLVEIISGLAMKGNQSKTADFAELGQRVRTTYGHFLSKGKWNEKKVSQKQQEGAFRKLAELALARQIPLYLSIDDTVIEKKNPSSRAKRPMEGTGWHYSHLEGKQVFGYQVFGANISVDDFSLCYCLRRCCPENGSKIDMAVVLLSYPKNAFGNHHALRVFICSDLTLSDEEILAHYPHRWNIEVMLKQQKMYMGLDRWPLAASTYLPSA